MKKFSGEEEDMQGHVFDNPNPNPNRGKISDNISTLFSNIIRFLATYEGKRYGLCIYCNAEEYCCKFVLYVPFVLCTFSYHACISCEFLRTVTVYSTVFTMQVC